MSARFDSISARMGKEAGERMGTALGGVSSAEGKWVSDCLKGHMPDGMWHPEPSPSQAAEMKRWMAKNKWRVEPDGEKLVMRIGGGEVIGEFQAKWNGTEFEITSVVRDMKEDA